jgi:hypothetical protein
MVPSSFNYSSSAPAASSPYMLTPDLTGSFVLRATTSACYTVTVSAVGTVYDVNGTIVKDVSYNSRTIQVSVAGYRSPPATPVLASARLGTDATTVDVTFDSTTDKGGRAYAQVFRSNFNCSKLFRFYFSVTPILTASTSLGSSGTSSSSSAGGGAGLMSVPSASNLQCWWLSDSQVRISVASAVLGDTVTLLPNIIRAVCAANTDCSSYQAAPTQMIPVTAPRQPLKAVAMLAATSYSIAYCEDILLDPTSSTGYGRQGWQQVRWAVSASTRAYSSGSSRITAIQTYLSTHYSDTSRVVVVPNGLLIRSTDVEDAVYTFTLTVTNFLGSISSSTVSVKVAENGTAVAPTFTLTGLKQTISRSESVNIATTIRWPSCGGLEYASY